MTYFDESIQLNEMENDVIGEVLNISMGSAATALSTILDKKVSITTPRIETIKVEDFEFSYLEPVLGVLIKYVEGVDGSNMLLLKIEDVKKILGHLLSTNPDELTEFDEISMSAICEIMNQMMGSSASALASFLGYKVSISPPDIMDTTDHAKVRNLFSVKGDYIVSVKFNISIDELVRSEFICILEPRFAREIIKTSLGNSEMPIAPAAEDKPAQEIKPVHSPVQAPEKVQAIPYTYKELQPEKPEESGASERNLDLIMSVPIQITVELGKTKKKIKDIAEFTLGNIIELDRQAGDQVDIIANGKLIAKGDVVVVDDNYSVRITEIMKARDSISENK